ncbi:MAG: endonuclease/exonuclease/phosphatase family protein [Ruminococcaceae bacterium]|nr:endonuclease/exonuclease/phosphatase family protein [Oscillospiraceae bacterium]
MEILNTIKNYILIIFSFLLVFAGIELPFGLPRDAVTDEETVRIMSFNIRYGEYDSRATIVPEVIADYKPDSVGIQECTFDWAITLGTLLDGYSFVGVGRDTGNLSPSCGEISAVLYRTEKYDLVDSGTFWLSETPDKVSFGWDAACRRICTWVILQNKETGEQYAHVNTHLDHVGYEARKNGTQLVVDFAKSFDMPVVVTGDFNYEKGCDFYNGIIASGLSDTQDLAEDTMTGKTYHGYNGGEEGLPIDFIFVNNKITDVSKYRILTTKYYKQYTSDHYPIYADMKF